jgi:cytochrome c biogenesis protein CcmG, thiol:disulfide interchange protein DsbE
MNRFLWPLVAFVLIAVVLAVGLRHSGDKGIIASPLIGKAVPVFDAPSLTDTSQHLTQDNLRGSWQLLNVWGTWCVECRAEHEALLAIQGEGRVPIVGLNWKDDDAAALAWLAQLGNPYSHVATDHDGRIAIDWGVYGAPESFLINPQGVIVEKQVGALTAAIWHDKFLPHLESR